MPVAAGLKVLVVDDQLSMRQVTRMALEKIGVRLIHEAALNYGSITRE